jgi:membrane-bound lytic murein transglycosylase A
MVRNNMIAPEELSLQGLIRYFKQNPDKLDWAMAINKRYVFFMPRSGGPFGSLNVPVTPFRSIATDKQVFPRAGVSFLTTQVPARTSEGLIKNHSYDGFACDQDTGGAIRAAGRCDLFMGTGDEVGELAGRTFSEGKLYYIYVKQDGQPSTMLASPNSPSAAVDVPVVNQGS